MNNSNSVMLLSILLKDCSEVEKNKLVDLYQKSFEQSEDFKELKRLLDACSFDGYEGIELIEKGREAIKQGLTVPQCFSQSITNIKYVVSKIKTLLEKTNEYVYSCNMNNVDLSIFYHEYENNIKEFYLSMLGCTSYIISSLFGVEFIKNCKINKNENIFDFINNVTSEVHSLFNEIQGLELPRKWVIKRTSFSGSSLIKYDGFVLLYENVDDIFVKNSMKSITPFIHYSETPNEILCCGIGNIIVTNENNVYSLIDSNIKMKLLPNHFDNVDIDYNRINPISLIKGNDTLNSYVINPSDLVEHLNRYFMMKTVKKRNEKGICAYCGESSCGISHFNIPRDY